VTEGWRKLHSEQLQNLYFSAVIRMKKSKRMRWVGHVDTWGDEKCLQNFGWKAWGEKDCFENLGIDERVLQMDLREVRIEGVD
jgi:hypothetical protein